MDANAHLPVSARLDAALRAELAAGERIIWSARPDPRRMLGVLWAWLFAIPWTLFSLVWIGVASIAFVSGATGDAPDFSWWFIAMPLFGVPFVAIGFWMLWQPVAALLDAGQQIHGLTNLRLMTLTLRNGKRVVSADVAKMGPVKRKEKADGWGSISIETGSHVDSEGDRITDTFHIAAIPAVAKLEHLLRDAQAARKI